MTGSTDTARAPFAAARQTAPRPIARALGTALLPLSGLTLLLISP